MYIVQCILVLLTFIHCTSISTYSFLSFSSFLSFFPVSLPNQSHQIGVLIEQNEKLQEQQQNQSVHIQDQSRHIKVLIKQKEKQQGQLQSQFHNIEVQNERQIEQQREQYEHHRNQSLLTLHTNQQIQVHCEEQQSEQKSRYENLTRTLDNLLLHQKEG